MDGTGKLWVRHRGKLAELSSWEKGGHAMTGNRQLEDLAGVGPATVADLRLLGVRSVADLARKDGDDLYQRLCELTGVQHDPCCLDIFRCAVAQARDPELPEEQKNWWYWSNLRKRKLSVLGEAV
ncbi:MAG TPA: helix-hairpin-helix domain-containing protein [Candidatus Angelobacter sp.]